jgi:hypothetical protein
MAKTQIIEFSKKLSLTVKTNAQLQYLCNQIYHKTLVMSSHRQEQTNKKAVQFGRLLDLGRRLGMTFLGLMIILSAILKITLSFITKFLHFLIQLM